MSAHVGHSGYHIDDFVAHILGVRGGEAYAHLRSRFSHYAQQIGKTGDVALFVNVMIRIDILSQEGHFFKSSIAHIGKFVEDAARLATAFATAGIGHDAIGAEVVASSHDADKTADATMSDALRDDIAICFGGGQLYVDCFFAHFGGSHQLRQR